jgi:protein-L-isoaspartate(D-aspartate) O-methyltransferase
MGARNIGDLSNASIAPAGPEAGLPGASFQRILVSATAPRVPPALLDQLAPGGTMVMPVGDALHTLVKMEDGEVRTDVYPGFVFVPLKNGARP